MRLAITDDIYCAHYSGDGYLMTPFDLTDSMAFLHTESGVVTVQMGAETVEVKAGEVIFIPDGIAVFALAEKKSSFAFLRISLSAVLSNMDLLDSELFGMFLLQAKLKPYLLSEEAEHYSDAMAVLEQVKTEFSAKETCFRLCLKAHVCRLLAILLRQYSNAKKEGDRLLYHNLSRFKEALAYAQSHMADKLTVASLSDLMHLSSDYFSKMLFESTGKTAQRYLQSVRINEAMRMLLNGETSFASVASAVGYGNADAFNRLFKQYVHLSLSSYAKLARQGTI